MLTGSRSLVLLGVCVAALLIVAVVVLLTRTGHAPSPGQRPIAGRRRDRTGPLAPSDAPTTTAGQ